MFAELQERIERVIHRQPTNPVLPLLAALEQLDIEPFSMSVVNAYKEEQVAKEFEKAIATMNEQGYRDITSHHEVAYPLYTVLHKKWLTPDLRYRYLGRVDRQPVLFALKWFRVPVAGNSESPSSINMGMLSGDFVWFKELPQFIQSKMSQITSAVPGATFETDTLRSEQQPYDPFLIVKLGDEEYYIEVWGDDDHKFPRG